MHRCYRRHRSRCRQEWRRSGSGTGKVPSRRPFFLKGGLHAGGDWQPPPTPGASSDGGTRATNSTASTKAAEQLASMIGHPVGGRAPPRLTRLRPEGHPALYWRPWPFERGDLLDSGGMGCRQSTSKDLRPETNALRKKHAYRVPSRPPPRFSGGKYRYR